MAPIDENTVRDTARLARLELDEAETRRLAEDFGRILGAFSELAEAAEAKEADGSHPAPSSSPAALRADEPRECLGADRALSGAPERIDDFYGVPKAVEG